MASGLLATRLERDPPRTDLVLANGVNSTRRALLKGGRRGLRILASRAQAGAMDMAEAVKRASGRAGQGWPDRAFAMIRSPRRPPDLEREAPSTHR